MRLAASPLCCSLSLRTARSASGTMTSGFEIAKMGHYVYRRVWQPTYYESFRFSRNFLSSSGFNWKCQLTRLRITLKRSI